MITQARLAATLDFQRPTSPRAKPRDVCCHCKRPVTLHEFTTPDGQRIQTAHCREHGDVVAVRSAIVNEV
ncbi:MAG: hypothetical protein EKK71_13375 [Candidatus Competibacteraceae bacterium]|nr:MAG: hypothetical protein EKK71_13375 [Candidatus Competibacteraceae bacterium]